MKLEVIEHTNLEVMLAQIELMQFLYPKLSLEKYKSYLK